MKNKAGYAFFLLASVLQLVTGGAAVVFFVVLAAGGQNVLPWIGALAVGVVLIVLGVLGIVGSASADEKETEAEGTVSEASDDGSDERKNG